MYPKSGVSDEERQKLLFDAIRKNIEKNLDEKQKSDLKSLGEKFHESFDVSRGMPKDLNEIDMEEALAYIVESLKAGIHPSYLDENERALLTAGYGEKWYEKWGYTEKDVVQ
jgi:hypothetical protein